MTEDGKFKTYIIKPGKLRGVERLEFIKEELEKYLLYDNLVVVLENYSFGSIGMNFSIGELLGMIKMLVSSYKKELILVPPTVWKKAIIGKGNANKSTIKWILERDLGLIFKTQDEADSYCLAEYLRRKNSK